MTGAPDPITVEVVRHAVLAIAEEMSVIVMRSARSPLLKEAGDLSSALTDARGSTLDDVRAPAVAAGSPSSRPPRSPARWRS